MTWAFTNAHDTINSSNWSYGATALYANGGNDYINMPANAQYLVVYAGEGHDSVWGSSRGDAVYGGNGDDYMSGRLGDDWLLGDAGRDWLLGDQGRDSLMGGHGADTLFGGADGDYFHFQTDHSIPVTGYADKIADWDVRQDYIVMHGARGTSTNYGEYQTSATDVNAIHSQIINSSWRYSKDNVFAYNSKTDTGYLFSDTNADNYFDNAIILNGAGSASDMNWTDIL